MSMYYICCVLHLQFRTFLSFKAGTPSDSSYHSNMLQTSCSLSTNGVSKRRDLGAVVGKLESEHGTGLCAEIDSKVPVWLIKELY